MRTRMILTLTLVALALGGCATYPGPKATCFNLLAGEMPCEFRPVSEELGGDA